MHCINKDRLHNAIARNNSEEMIQELKNGAKFNNKHVKKNSINCAIRSTLNLSVDRFDLGFFINMLDHGAEISINGQYDALMQIITHSSRYFDKAQQNDHRDLAVQNVVNLIDPMINRGVNYSKYPCPFDADILKKAIILLER
jgi:hypothetical protein